MGGKSENGEMNTKVGEGVTRTKDKTPPGLEITVVVLPCQNAYV